MVSTTTCAVALVALLAVATAAVTSHSSTEEPVSTSTTLRSSTTSPKSLMSTTTTAKTLMSTTKRSVTEELEDIHILGSLTQNDSDEDDSDEIDDEPLPTLLPTSLMPPKQDVEVFKDNWNSSPKPTDSKVPMGILIIRIIQIVKPKEENSQKINPFNLQGNNYKPIYSSTLSAGADDTSCSDEVDEGQKMTPTPQTFSPMRGDNKVPSYRIPSNYPSTFYPSYSPFRLSSSLWDRPSWFNNGYRGVNTFRNYNY